MFQKSVELDPGYAIAYEALAFSYLEGYIWQLDKDPGVLDRAAELVDKAIALDDSDSDAYAMLGGSRRRKTNTTELADGKQAVSLDPNSAFAWLALADINDILWAESKPEEVLACGPEGDPHRSPQRDLPKQEGGLTLRWGGMRKRSGSVKKRFLARFPTVPRSTGNLIHYIPELGREHDARAEVAEVLALVPGSLWKLGSRGLPGEWQGLQ